MMTSVAKPGADGREWSSLIIPAPQHQSASAAHENRTKFHDALAMCIGGYRLGSRDTNNALVGSAATCLCEGPGGAHSHFPSFVLQAQISHPTDIRSGTDGFGRTSLVEK